METANLLLESLKRELALHQQALEQGQTIVEREQQYCLHIRALIDLEVKKESLGKVSNGNVPEATPPSADSPVVKRQPGYAAVSVSQAARQILGAVGKLHADELVKRIFVIDSPSKLQRAKNALVSELVRGTKLGHFVRTGPNEFALPSTH